MKRYIKYIIIFLVIVVFSFFIIFNSDIFHEKYYYYSNIDFYVSVPVDTRIYFSDLYVGRVKSIRYDIEKEEKIIEFYIFVEYINLLKFSSKLILRVDDENNLKRIYIYKDKKDSTLIPEGGYLDSIVER
jgi:hypothetical protein